MVPEPDDVGRGREAFRQRQWAEAFGALSQADHGDALAAADMCLLAWSAYLTGRHHDFFAAMQRAHRLYLAADGLLPAARCAFWLGFVLGNRGEIGPATGWFGRARRLVERTGSDSVECGYIVLPELIRHAQAGEWAAVHEAAAKVYSVGERFAEPDLLGLGLHWQGRAMVRLERLDEGLALLDEAMVAVVAGELSPAVTGVVYCSMIEICRDLYDLRRSQEWTTALSRWCDEQPDLVPYTAQCLVHRAQLKALHGAWPEALAEARRAGEQIAQGSDPVAAAAARYEEGDVHRLLGHGAEAEAAYRAAGELGLDPQPGLALLRLSQGDGSTATAMLRRALGEATDPLARARLLPAVVDVGIAVGRLDEARAACLELDDIATRHPSTVLGAIAAGARGALDLAEGRAESALTSLRQAGEAWRSHDAPYEVARIRARVAAACRLLGDNEAADVEFRAARSTFERLGAVLDLALTAPSPPSRPPNPGLTSREREVLRLVCAGKTNKAIAAELFISEKTVDRHVSSILAKLGVVSRTAATAYAYQHRLC